MVDKTPEPSGSSKAPKSDDVLGKLGVSSRGEAAAMAYQQHLLDDS